MKPSDVFYAWQKLILRNKPATILRKLDKMIQEDGGIFKDDPSYKEFRSLSLQFRISLLLEWKRYAEALAWLCLETEVNPTNKDAWAMKEQLKKQLRFSTEDNITTISNKLKAPIFMWGPVAGMRRLKAIIERDIILPIKEPEFYRAMNVTIPKGMLLYGPPGCGKTFIVKRIALMLRFNFVEVSPSTIASTYVHGTQEKIKKMFEDAHKNRPCLLFIDELEAFVPNRSRTDVSYHYQAEVNEFLIQLNNAYQNGIFVVGATNHLNMIDEAVVRPGRFDLKLFVGPPDLEARIEAFKQQLKYKAHKITKWLYLGEETENFTFSEITYVVDQAAREVANQKKDFIDLNDIMKVVTRTHAQLTDEKIRSYMR
ncbi:MAG: ATP-binding protein [Bacteroidales bacterium]|nr:ATP-binding protein [Bacteroidales bacterium]